MLLTIFFPMFPFDLRKTSENQMYWKGDKKVGKKGLMLL